MARSCPECRVLSHYVVPSAFVPESAERKAMLIDGYLARLKHLPCKHFAFGEGKCPFGAACFYSHTDRSGRPVGPEPARRVLAARGGGRGSALAQYRLSDYLFAPEASGQQDLLEGVPVRDLRLEDA